MLRFARPQCHNISGVAWPLMETAQRRRDGQETTYGEIDGRPRGLANRWPWNLQRLVGLAKGIGRNCLAVLRLGMPYALEYF